jgi:hypothetical protein
LIAPRHQAQRGERRAQIVPDRADHATLQVDQPCAPSCSALNAAIMWRTSLEPYPPILIDDGKDDLCAHGVFMHEPSHRVDELDARRGVDRARTGKRGVPAHGIPGDGDDIDRLKSKKVRE